MVNSNCSQTLLKIIGVGIFATAAIQIYAVSKITSPSAAGPALLFQGKDPFELARSQSFGFFYDITNDHWNLLHDMYVNHRNHRHPDHPLKYNPGFETGPKGWLNSASTWYQNVSDIGVGSRHLETEQYSLSLSILIIGCASLHVHVMASTFAYYLSEL